MEILVGGLLIIAAICGLIALASTAVVLWALWKMLIKMGEPGWIGIVPFYNMYKMAEKTFNNGWIMLLWFVPIVGPAYFMYKVGKCFGAEEFPAIVLAILAPIGILVYGFNKAEWIPPVNL